MLFLSDLDGTLLDSNGNVTDEDVECIHQWTQKHAFGFVTGRDRAFCLALALKYQLSCEYMITDNGANAYYKDKNVYSSLIDLILNPNLFQHTHSIWLSQIVVYLNIPLNPRLKTSLNSVVSF